MILDFQQWSLWRKFLFFTLVWSAYGCIYYGVNRLTVNQIELIEVVSFVSVFALVTHGVFALLSTYWKSKRYGLAVAALLVFYSLVWLLGNAVFNVVNPRLRMPMNHGQPVSLSNPGYLKHIITVISNFSVLGVTAYIYQRAIDYLLAMNREQAQKLEEIARREQAEAERGKYEYLNLAGELPAHFMVNAIQSWQRDLVLGKPGVGDSMDKVYELQRYHLEAREQGREVVPLQREVDLMRLYLEQKSRPENPVYVHYELTEHTMGYSIPPTTLIGFAENACKHGVANNPLDPIRIVLDVRDGVLRFTCRNRINTAANRTSHGVGLANVRRRLEIMYGDRFTLSARTEGEVYVLELTIEY